MLSVMCWHRHLNLCHVVCTFQLVLNLGHSPLYRHLCKCIYIEMLKIHLFVNYYILFLAMAKFKQACFAHDLSKKVHTFYTHVIFGCTRHSSNKFGSALVGTKILRSTILEKACFGIIYLLRIGFSTYLHLFIYLLKSLV